MIKLQGISKSYESGTVVREVLKDLDFELKRGEKAAVMGPSGTGKTTLLNLCGAMDKPDRGEVLFEGQSLPWSDPAALARYRNNRIGFVFQEHYLLSTLTVLENILVPAMVKGRSTDADLERALFLLRVLGLDDRRDSFPGELSGGENQRVAVARALINKPDLLLCDEPTGSLDEENSDLLMDLLLGTAEKENTSVILVTHSPHIGAKLDRIYTLNHGRLIGEKNS